MTTAVASHPPRMPEVRKVILKAGEPETVVLATLYGGHYVSHDGGETWFNVCHEALGSDDSETYGALFTEGGTFVAATGYRGISSTIDGCTWSEWLPPDRSFITELSLIGASGDGSESAGDVLALDRQEPQRLWASNARGRSFLPYGTALPAELDVSTLVASKDGWHVYVGAKGADGAALLHTADAAESWEALPLPAANGGTVDVVGLAANDPTVVVVRVATPSQTELRLSRDAGQNWSTIFSTTHSLPAALLADDGTLFFGGPDEGLWRGLLPAEGAAPAFEHASDVAVLDLTAGDGRLFAVTSQLTSGYSVALSVDGGTTFAPFFDVCDAAVSASCTPESTVAAVCSGTNIEMSAWQPLGNACSTKTGEPDLPEPPPPADPIDQPATSSCTVTSRRGNEGGRDETLLALAAAVLTIHRRIRGTGRARRPRSRRAPS